MTPTRSHRLITGRHIEIDTGHIALYLVVGFKNGTAIACRLAGAKLGVAICRFILNLVDFAQRVVASLVVHKTVSGYHVNDVGLDAATTKPALRNGVLAVVAVAFLLVGAGLVINMLVVGGIRIPVAHIAVSTGVRLLIAVVESVIAHIAAFRNGDDAAQRSLQRRSLIAVGTLIVRFRTVGSLCPTIAENRQQDNM